MNLTYSEPMVGGLWTLPLEVQMYLVLPLLFVGLRWRAVRYCLAVWALSIPIALLQPQISARLITMSYAPCFLAGVLAWRLSLVVKRRISGFLWPIAFTAVWPIFLFASREHQLFYRYAFCLALGLAIPHFAECRIRLLNRAANIVARYSYGIYLSHIAVMLLVLRLAPPWRWPVFVALAVGFPIAIYHLLEQPFIKLGQRLSARWISPGKSGAHEVQLERLELPVAAAAASCARGPSSGPPPGDANKRRI